MAAIIDVVLLRLRVMAAILICILAGGRLSAQLTDIEPPHVVQSTDENSVDLISGKFSLNVPGLSIGSSESGLSFSLVAHSDQIIPSIYSGIQTENIRFVSNNSDGYEGVRSIIIAPGVYDSLQECFRNFQFSKASGVGIYHYSSCANGNNKAINLTSPDFSKATTELQSGGVMSLESANIVKYLSRDGVVIRFELTYPNANLKNPQIFLVERTKTIDFPNGIHLSYYYKDATVCLTQLPSGQCIQSQVIYRPQSITSSLGYQLKIEFSSDTLPSGVVTAADMQSWSLATKVTAINNSVDYCDPNSDHCLALSQVWPAVQLNRIDAAPGYTYSVVDPLNQATNFTYTQISPGVVKLTGVRRPSSSSDNIILHYNSDNRVDTINRDGLITSYTYTLTGQVADNGASYNQQFSASAVAPLGRHWASASTWDNSYYVGHVGGPADRMTSFTDGLGHQSGFSYDASGRLLKTVAPEGNYVSYVYDGRSNITEKRLVGKSGAGPNDIVTTAGYDLTCSNSVTCNKPNWTKDAKGSQTDYTYDPVHGGILTITSPPSPSTVRPQQRFIFTALHSYYKQSLGGSPVASSASIYELTKTSSCVTSSTCAGTADETVSLIAYGPQVAGSANNLLPVSRTARAGNGSLTIASSYGYDAIGNLIAVDGPLSGSADTTRLYYDLARQLSGIAASDPDDTGPLKFRALRYSRNLDGRLTKVEQGTVDSQAYPDLSSFSSAFASLQETDSAFDAAGRKIQEATVAGGAMYEVTQFSYDDAGRPDCVATRMDPTNWSSPNAACSPVTGANGADRIVKYSYDTADQILSILSGYGTARQRAEKVLNYTANGNILSLRDANFNLTKWDYDDLDRQVKTSYPKQDLSSNDSSTTDYEQTFFDNNGNVTKKINRDGSVINYSYDDLNRLVVKSPSVGNATYYGYDLLGHLIYARFGSDTGPGITNGFDVLGRLTSSSSDMDGTPRIFNYGYDAAGSRTQITFPDGKFFNYVFDDANELIWVNQMGPNHIISFNYDNVGRRSQLGFGGVASNYTYNPIGRLTNLTHDLAGNAKDVSITIGGYNPAGQVLSKSIDNDVYAWNGSVNVNRDYIRNGLNQYSSAGVLSLNYDAKGNLTGDGSDTYVYDAENRLISVAGLHNATLDYDPLGRLWQISPSTGGATRFAYDGDSLAVEYDASGNILRRYMWGPGVDEPLAWWEASGLTNKRTLRSDEQGSVDLVTDNVGNFLAANTYDEFGIPGSTNLGRFQYTGQMWLPEIGVYYYKARMYSPTLGRFMQTDPARIDGGVNLYNYAGGDPINSSDPDGSIDIPIIIRGSIPSLPTIPNIPGTGTTPALGAGCVQNPQSCGNHATPPKQHNQPGKGAKPCVPGVDKDCGVIAGPGIGHNGGPPLDDIGAEAPDVLAGASDLLSLRNLTGIGLLLQDILYPDGAGESHEVLVRLAQHGVSTGRYTPETLAEQIAMRLAKSHPEAGTVINLQGGFKDARFPSGSVKMRQGIGEGENHVEIHYVKTPFGTYTDFKIK